MKQPYYIEQYQMPKAAIHSRPEGRGFSRIWIKKQAVHIDEKGREYIWQDAGKAHKRYLDEVFRQCLEY